MKFVNAGSSLLMIQNR